MREHNVNYVIVGLFVIAMLSAAMVFVSLVAGRTGTRETYYTVLDNVADVKFGTQVRYEGFPIGQVEEITPVAEGAGMRFRLRLGIHEGWQIPSDSTARIGSTSFLAAKTIDIDSGHAETAIATGGDIPGGSPSDMFAAMSEVAAEFDDLSQDGIKPLLERITQMVERVSGGLERELGGLLGNLVALSETLETRTPKTIDRIDLLVGRLDASAQRLQQVLSSENAASLERLIVNAEEASQSFKTTSAELTRTMAKVDDLAANLNQLVTQNRDGLDRSLADVQYTLGTVSRNIDAIIQNLDATTRNMNEFSRMIRRNPGLLLGGTASEEISSEHGATNGIVQ